MNSLKQTELINLIIDKTGNISIKQIICFGLKYVEKDSAVIKGDVFKIRPDGDESGKSERISHN